MSHEVETMAWANEVPWHGLGQRVDDCISVDDMLVAAKLNWEVKPVPLFAELDGKRIAVNRAAQIRATDHKVLTVTGLEWKTFQNKNVLEFFRHWTEAGGAKLETAGSLHGGRMIWALASIQAGFSLNGRDAVKSYILLTSPHEVGRAIQVRVTPIRVVCANTMAMAMNSSELHYSQSHVKDFDIDKARETVRLAKEGMEQLHMDAKLLQKLKMSKFDNVRFLASFFQPVEENKDADAHAQALINDVNSQNTNMAKVLWALDKAPGAVEGNAWGTFNAVTYWADHLNGRERDARMFKSWLGASGKIKQDVKDQLLQLAA